MIALYYTSITCYASIARKKNRLIEQLISLFNIVDTWKTLNPILYVKCVCAHYPANLRGSKFSGRMVVIVKGLLDFEMLNTFSYLIKKQHLVKIFLSVVYR